jgi:hypothetical protein
MECVALGDHLDVRSVSDGKLDFEGGNRAAKSGSKDNNSRFRHGRLSPLVRRSGLLRCSTLASGDGSGSCQTNAQID